jgi:hypothetical protein
LERVKDQEKCREQENHNVGRGPTYDRKVLIMPPNAGRFNLVLNSDNTSRVQTKTNAHRETGQMAVCCQNLTLGVLSIRSALSVLVGALFKRFGLFLNTPRIP